MMKKALAVIVLVSACLSVYAQSIPFYIPSAKIAALNVTATNVSFNGTSGLFLGGGSLDGNVANTCVGVGGCTVTSGHGGNVVVGYQSDAGNGSSNTVLGGMAGYGLAAGNYSNVLIGFGNGGSKSCVTTGNGNIQIGADSCVSSPSGNGQLSIQNIIFGTNNTGYGSGVSTGSIGIGVRAPAAKLDVAGPIKTLGYTVSTLPSGVVGMRAYVTDATSCTFMGSLTGGGSTVCPTFYNGTAWLAE